MENATKALVMAGTALIAILLISFLLLIFRKGGSANAEYNATMSDTELAKFNSQFEVYDVKNNTYFDVITVVNLAYDLNNRDGYDIKVSVNIDNKLYELDNDNKNELKFNDSSYNIYSLVDENTKIINNRYKYRFECDGITYSDVSGKVNGISFKRETNN